MDITEHKDGSVHVRVRVQPRASRNQISLEPDGRIKVVLTAAPVEGAANKAVAEMVAGALGVAKSAVAVVKGDKSREKTLAIAGLKPEEVRVRLEKASQK